MTKDNDIRSLAREVREELKREEARHGLMHGKRKTSYQPRTLPPAVPLAPIGPRVGRVENAGIPDLRRFGEDKLTAAARKGGLIKSKDAAAKRETLQQLYGERYAHFRTIKEAARQAESDALGLGGYRQILQIFGKARREMKPR